MLSSFSALHVYCLLCLFFFNDTATTEIYTLSLHDALPIFIICYVLTYAITAFAGGAAADRIGHVAVFRAGLALRDRKSTRLNSSHGYISYAVFCLKKKKKNKSSSRILKRYSRYRV